MKNQYPITVLALFLLTLFLGSCGSVKHSQMIMLDQVMADTSMIDSFPVLKIRTDDIINIFVTSRNPGDLKVFNKKLIDVFSVGARRM